MKGATPAGYSGTPLAKKLGIKSGMEVCLVDAPAGYLDLVAPLPEGVKFVRRLTPATDIVHAFPTRQAKLREVLAECRRNLKPAGMLWISWPKKAARMPTDITENTIRERALPLGFVDIKVCAVDEVWSGLKLVVRKDLRTKEQSA